ncbi:MAG TPA: EAL domain-containing protein [Jatrophihabitans sp.]|nr:EAL domain-containing protein [Jatrophihabitans sp.]
MAARIADPPDPDAQRDPGPEPAGHRTTVPPIADPRWRAALRAVLADPARLRLHAQPIVELTSGTVAGFELLARFDGPWQATPDRWFAAAEHWLLNPPLQSRVLALGIAARAGLPPNTFLTVNLDPHLLDHPGVAEVLTGAGDLSRLVLELTEHTRSADAGRTAGVLERIRELGGLIAMDDAGTGYAGLSTLLQTRPDIVKLDRDLIEDLDRDPVKRALVEVLGDLTGRMDAWVLAEGIETRAELDCLVALGVPLGQGYLLGRPAAGLAAQVEPALADHIRATSARTSLTAHVVSLLRVATAGRERDRHDVLLGEDGRAALVRTGPAGWAPAMTVAPSATVAEVGRRAMARPEAHRYAPLVCTDGRGAVLGLVRIDDLLTALCTAAEPHS